jgi:hypothetical protein
MYVLHFVYFVAWAPFGLVDPTWTHGSFTTLESCEAEATRVEARWAPVPAGWTGPNVALRVECVKTRG